ncbi:hypothetical protein [Undibacterium sp. Ren11W]|uniref:hypothetical protein n=1 Tax=Undibacterium sp. Ren11W TaxID=3413045 RepID=UPI003BF3ED47
MFTTFGNKAMKQTNAMMPEYSHRKDRRMQDGRLCWDALRHLRNQNSEEKTKVELQRVNFDAQFMAALVAKVKTANFSKAQNL